MDKDYGELESMPLTVAGDPAEKIVASLRRNNPAVVAG